jgi:UPF0042 nucleotide-binding protein
MTDIDIKDMPGVVIVTGMSGAGRTEAMHVFEDLGYFCVDNLPSSLISDMVDLCMPTDDGTPAKKLAVVCDARNKDYFGNLTDQLVALKDRGIDFKVLFLDAADSKLVARYKSSRRRHPMCVEGTTIAQGIARERALMQRLRDNSDYVIDTTDMMPTQLRTTLRSLFGSASDRSGLAVTVYSFGFKHGSPLDADLVMDVRFLPNPYYDPELRAFTGLDAPVRDFVMHRDETAEFNNRWHALLDVVMPGYVSEGKQQLAIAIGCTGGQHRSVALAESTGDYLKSKGYRVSVAHRDLDLARK